jgi:hypothetical protein
MFEKVLRTATAIVLLAALTGCAERIVLHPMMPDDMIEVPVGTKIGPETTIKHGWFVSDEYLEEVAKTRVHK